MKGKKLPNIGELWGKAKSDAKKSGFSEAVPVDPGKYSMQLVSCTIDEFGDQRQVMLKWCVLDEGDFQHSTCTMWLSLAEDRIVWLARLLGSLGVDIEETDIETEDDLAQVFKDLIEANTVARTKVREKDGYTNMYVNGVADVDSADLVDPDEIMENQGGGKKDDEKSSSGKGKSDKSKKNNEEEDVVEIDVGDTVSFKHPKTKEETEGEIVDFNEDDDTANIKIEGEKKTVRVKVDQLEPVGDDDDDDDGDEDKELEVDDVVIVKVKGKEKSGVVKKIAKGKAHVKLKGVEELHVCDVDEVEFEKD